MLLTGLNNIKVPWYLLNPDSSTDKSEIMNDINSFYESIVSALLSAAESSVPKRKSNYYKFWCDTELDLLKEESIDKHKVWSSLGRPRMGPYFLEMRISELKYKQVIKDKEKASQHQFSYAVHFG